LIGHFSLLPPRLTHMPFFSKFFSRRGFLCSMVIANLFSWMAALVVKMVPALGVQPEIPHHQPRLAPDVGHSDQMLSLCHICGKLL
jgi:hypothetical protein